MKEKTDKQIFTNILYGENIDIKTLESITNIELQGIKLESPHEFVNFSAIPKPKANSLVNKNNREILDHIIKRKDILITHYQLTRVIDGTLLIRNKEIHNINDIINVSTKKTPGKSQAKAAAQVAARAIAKYLWKNDKEEQIKTGAMCQLLWGTLLESEHKDQLPDTPEALRNWIKDIAPSHAREAGRPKEKYGASST